MTYLLIGLIGLAGGILSGLFGIGGGLVIVPGLVLLAGFSLTAAAGTSLVALLLPVGVIGALEYWRTVQVDLPAAASTVKSASRRTACASSSSTADQVSERDFRASVMLRLPVQIVVGWPQEWTCTMIEDNVGAA